MSVTILHWRGHALYTSETATTIRDALEEAVGRGVDLIGADLRGANLRGAILDGAILDGASLVGASLGGADLVGASLVGAYLVGADLVGAYLDGANLRGAILDGANLRGASLDGANIVGASLRGADLSPIRDDLHAVLDTARAEVPGLLAALRAGKVDGSTYTGECACLVGTIAHVRHCSVDDLACDSSRPIERFFMALRPGHTPQNHPVAAIVERWIVDYCAQHEIAIEAQP